MQDVEKIRQHKEPFNTSTSMANIPGAYPGPANILPPPYSTTAPARNGKFPDISRFMVNPDINPPLPLTYKVASVAGLKPGWIIYIRDQQSRLDERVMLVLCPSTAGFTCLSFCLHWPPASYRDHWQVVASSAAEDRNDTSRMGRMKVVLQPYGPEPQLSPQENITINIGDLWNVENEVNVAVLGFVKRRSMLEVVEAVKWRFCHSLDMAVRGPEPSNRGFRRRRS
jgi:hypothetical protein